MPRSTLKIIASQRDALYEQVRTHLGALTTSGSRWSATKDFATAERLAIEFGERLPADGRPRLESKGRPRPGRVDYGPARPDGSRQAPARRSQGRPRQCPSRTPGNQGGKGPRSLNPPATPVRRSCRCSGAFTGVICVSAAHRRLRPRGAGWPRPLLSVQARRERTADRHGHRQGDRSLSGRSRQLPRPPSQSQAGPTGEEGSSRLPPQGGEGAMSRWRGRPGRGRPRLSVFRPKDRADMRGLAPITFLAQSELTSAFRGAIHGPCRPGSPTDDFSARRLPLALPPGLPLAIGTG